MLIFSLCFSLVQKKPYLCPLKIHYTMAKEDYEITALFSTDGEVELRHCLSIELKGSNVSKNDLTVIMMNPGSASPAKESEKEVVSTDPTDIIKKLMEQPIPNCTLSYATEDPTIKQIIRVMEKYSFNQTTIINLSDIKNPESTNFINYIKDKNVKTIEDEALHSIFSTKNRKALNIVLSNSPKVLLAWGVSPRIKGLQEEAYNILKMLQEKYNFTLYGLPHKEKKRFGFYHPLPQEVEKQQEWIEQQLNSIP